MGPPAGARRAEAPAAAPPPPGVRRGRSVAAAIAGALLLALVIYYAGVEPVLERLRALSWAAPLIILPYVIINVCDTLGWRQTLPPRVAVRVPFNVLYLVRMAGEAVNSITPTATVGGEPLKVHLLRAWGVTSADGVASVVIAKTALTLAQIAFILVGLSAFFDTIDQGALGAAVLGLLLVVSLGFALLLVRLQRRGPAATIWRWLRRVVPRARFVARLEQRARAIDERLADFYGDEQGAFLRATFWHFAAWMLGVGEVWLVMTLIGEPVGWEKALVIEALSQPIRAAALIIPGGLGAQEAGGVALCHALGVPEAGAATLWLLKRARELFFDGIGLAYLTHQTAARRTRPVEP